MESAKYNSWVAILSSFLSWCFVYLVTTLIFRNRYPEYWSRIVALLHGLYTAFQGTNQCFIDDWSFDDPNKPTTSYQAFIILFSLGYFMEDLLWCLYEKSESNLMVAHHVYSCIALTRILFSGTTGGQTTCVLGAMEITNPFLQARWFIRSHGMRETALFGAVEISFMLLFFVLRIVVGSYVSLLIIFNPQNDWEYKILSILIYVMSWMFMVNIGQYFYMKYLRGNIDERLQQVAPS